MKLPFTNSSGVVKEQKRNFLIHSVFKPLSKIRYSIMIPKKLNNFKREGYFYFHLGYNM